MAHKAQQFTATGKIRLSIQRPRGVTEGFEIALDGDRISFRGPGGGKGFALSSEMVSMAVNLVGEVLADSSLLDSEGGKRFVHNHVANDDGQPVSELEVIFNLRPVAPPS